VPDEVLTCVDDLLARLEEALLEPYGLHWDNDADGEPFGCMLFFSADGGLVAGVAVRDENGATWLKNVAAVVDGKFGYVTSEEPPPDTAASFVERCRSAHVTRLVDGQVIWDG
jgi:hypothetical protein